MSIKKGSKTIASSVPVTEWGSVDGTLADQADLKSALDSKAALYSPIFTGTPLAPTAAVGTNNNQVATTKFVQNALLNAGSDLPDMEGNSGKFLKTDGEISMWESISQVPSQSGQSGKFLTTNGSSASWSNLTGVVHTTGNEIVQGVKSFKSNLIYQSTNMTGGTPPESNLAEVGYAYKDSNGKYLGLLQYTYNTNGSGNFQFRAYKPDGVGVTYSNIRLGFDSSGNAYAEAPTPSDTTSTSATQIATTGWVNTVGNNIVHRTGDETIDGDKTFNTTLFLKNNTMIQGNVNNEYTYLAQTYADFVKGSNPSVNRGLYINLLDSGTGSTVAKNSLARLQLGIDTNGTTNAELRACKNVNDSTTHAKIGIYYPTSGKPYTYAPTPEANSNDTQIATTAWVTSKVSNVTLNDGTNISIDNNKNINYTGPRYYKFATRTWTYAQWIQYCERGVTTSLSPSYTVTGIKSGDLVSIEGICSDRNNTSVLAWGIAQGEPDSSTNNVSITFLGLNIQEDNILVHTINAETIAGNKTFTSKQIMSVTGNDIITNEIKDDTVVVDSTPEANRVRRIRFTDKNGARIGELQAAKSTSGVQTVAILASNAISGTTVNASLLVGVDSSGNSYATCPTPPENSNNTKIATTAWVNTKLTSAYIPNYTSPTTASTSYSPTANGTLHAFVSGGGCWVQIAQGSHVLARSQTTDSTSGQQCVWIIAKKGQTYTVTASATPTVTFYPFG